MSRLFVSLPLLLLAAGVLRADAVVVTQAMRSTTIAEVFVEEKGVRARLEVGGADLAEFAAFLPKKLLQDPEARKALRLPADPVPTWKIFADGAELAPTRIESKLARRIVRDVVTGEPTGEGDEPVVQLSIEYTFAARPKTMTLGSPPGVQIGFVLYDRGLPVNDFRYLPREATVDLDAEDPWYSKFRHRNLWRRFDAPLSAFLYVESYEIRKEVVVRPRDLQQWVDLGVEGRDVLPIEEQEAVMQKAAVFLRNRAPVEIDGAPADFELERVHFVRRSLRRTGVIDPPEELSLASATLGVIFVHARGGTLPKTVTMRWDLFGPRIQRVPAVATDEAGGLPSWLTPEDDILTWTNFLKNPRAAGFLAVPEPRSASALVPWVAWALAVIGLIALVRRRWVGGALLLVIGGALLLTRGDEAPRGEVVGALLRNTYRAFDLVGESAVYDALERSVDGAVLDETYLQTRRALELQNQGGARVKVNEVTLESCDARSEGESFRARCAWTVQGSVGHWGHLHQRSNRYDAEIGVAIRDGAWKIVSIEMLDEARVE